MTQIVNPLQALINQASSLEETGEVERYSQRVNPNGSGQRLLLLDLSGSMVERVGSSSKIEILRRAIAPIQQGYRIFGFGSTVDEIKGEIPFPSGGTAMHLAFEVVAPIKPVQTLVVSDGIPDDRHQALISAKALSGIISTLFIGEDSDHEAIEFMRKLARLGCGKFHFQDLRAGDLALKEAVIKMLPEGEASR